MRVPVIAWMRITAYKRLDVEGGADGSAFEHLLNSKKVGVPAPALVDRQRKLFLVRELDQKQLALTVYQCRRWDPDFLAIQQVLKRGTIGTPFHIETFIGGYAHPCDYWHSHEPISGGVFYDWGSH